jgi:hypothetical protein
MMFLRLQLHFAQHLLEPRHAFRRLLGGFVPRLLEARPGLPENAAIVLIPGIFLHCLVS